MNFQGSFQILLTHKACLKLALAVLPIRVSFGDLLGSLSPWAGSSHPSKGIRKPFPGIQSVPEPQHSPSWIQQEWRPGQDRRWPQSHRGPSPSTAALGGPDQCAQHRAAGWGGMAAPAEPSPPLGQQAGGACVPPHAEAGGGGHRPFPGKSSPSPGSAGFVELIIHSCTFRRNLYSGIFTCWVFYSLLNKQIPRQGTWETWGLCGQNFSELLYWTYKTQFNPFHRTALHEAAGQ